MAGYDIETFRNVFETGARSYLFYVVPSFPSGITVTPEASYLVKTASLPTSNFEELIASWQGFDYKAAGKRTYDTWSVTFNVDIKATVRKAFVSWMDMILNPANNRQTMPTTYMRDQTISLLGIDFQPIMTYKLVAAWPSQVGEVTLDYADSAFASFDVTFTYLYYKTS